MGSGICKNVHLYSDYSRRTDLKNSRFDPKEKKKNNLKRAQVQPVAQKIANLSSSHWNHTKSSMRSATSDEEEDFVEELNCDYCKDTVSNGMIVDKIASESISSEKPMSIKLSDSGSNATQQLMSPTYDYTHEQMAHQTGSVVTKVNDDILVNSDNPQLQFIEPTNNEEETKVEEEEEEEALTEEIKGNENDSETDIMYRSISTIPIFGDKDSDSDDDDSVSVTNFPILSRMKSCSMPQGLKESCESDDMDVWHCGVDKQTTHSELRYKEKCDFCDFVKKGYSQSWNDLDKDVLLLMDTADKLTTLLTKKESLIEQNVCKHKEDKTQNDCPQINTFDTSEDIVEEKNVSLSFLERFKGNDFKEKVQMLRNKRRIGISLMKTSKGKRLMVFSDGVNTYQIHGLCIPFFISKIK